jgi:hypothetical protein
MERIKKKCIPDRGNSVCKGSDDKELGVSSEQMEGWVGINVMIPVRWRVVHPEVGVSTGIWAWPI